MVVMVDDGSGGSSGGSGSSGRTRPQIIRHGPRLTPPNCFLLGGGHTATGEDQKESLPHPLPQALVLEHDHYNYD